MDAEKPHGSIPIFPLSRVVLFPDTHVPLHIFEPRYRQMTEEALRTDRRMGMVAVRSGFALEGDPPVFEVGCAGTIRECEALSGGRYNLVLEAERRFLIRRELPRPEGRLYRVAQVEWLEEGSLAEHLERIAALRPGLMQRLAQLVGVAESDFERQHGLEHLATAEDALLVNTLCQILDLPTPEKQSLLELDDAASRCEQLLEILDFHIAALAASPAPDRSRLN